MNESLWDRRINRGLDKWSNLPRGTQPEHAPCTLTPGPVLLTMPAINGLCSHLPGIREKTDPGSGRATTADPIRIISRSWDLTPSDLFRKHEIHGLSFLLLCVFHFALDICLSPKNLLLCILRFLILAGRGRNIRNHTLNYPSFSYGFLRVLK